MRHQDKFHVIKNKGERKMSVALTDKRKKVFEIIEGIINTNNDDYAIDELFENAWEFRKELNITENDISLACKEVKEEIYKCL